MQTLRIHPDVSRQSRTSDALGRDAGALGRRVLAAAQAATAMHLAESTSQSLRFKAIQHSSKAEDPR